MQGQLLSQAQQFQQQPQHYQQQSQQQLQPTLQQLQLGISSNIAGILPSQGTNKEVAMITNERKFTNISDFTNEMNMTNAFADVSVVKSTNAFANLNTNTNTNVNTKLNTNTDAHHFSAGLFNAFRAGNPAVLPLFPANNQCNSVVFCFVLFFFCF